MVKFTCGGRPAYVEVSCIEMIKEPCTNKGAYLSLANNDWIVVDQSVEEVYAAIQKFWE